MGHERLTGGGVAFLRITRLELAEVAFGLIPVHAGRSAWLNPETVSFCHAQDRSGLSTSPKSRPPFPHSKPGKGDSMERIALHRLRTRHDKLGHDGVMPFPPLEIVNTVVPASAAPRRRSDY